MAKAKVVAPTREELVSTAKEVSAILGLDTPIKITKKMTDEEIIEAIKSAADGQVYESDFDDRSDEEGEEEGVSFFSALADEVMQKIKVDVVPGAPPVAGEEVEEEIVEDEEEVEEAPAPKAVKVKAEKAEKPAKAPKAEKAPKAKKEKKIVVTRVKCLCDSIKSIKKSVTIQELADMTNDMYVDNDGASNIKQTLHMINVYMPVLIAFGFCSRSGDVVTIL